MSKQERRDYECGENPATGGWSARGAEGRERNPRGLRAGGAGSAGLCNTPMTRLDEVRWADSRVGERQALVAADLLGEPIMPAKRAGTERPVRAQPEADQLK
jgi:hypothetical protein